MIRRVLKLGDNNQDIHFYYRSLLVICLHPLPSTLTAVYSVSRIDQDMHGKVEMAAAAVPE